MRGGGAGCGRGVVYVCVRRGELGLGQVFFPNLILDSQLYARICFFQVCLKDAKIGIIPQK